MSSSFRLNRRTFLKTLGAAGLAAPFFARNLHAQAPSRVLRHASFGANGMAWADIQGFTSNPWVKLVAVADVDLNRANLVRQNFPDCKIYQDWRELLDKEGKNLDSVNVSVPDHMHAPIALSAMQLGKHCYCQKPLAHDLHEVRTLTKFAHEKKLVSTMGIQIHSYKVYRQAVELVQKGAIGKVKEVHTWSSKKWGDMGPPPDRKDPVPDGLNWDLWLGGCAERPFITGYYHPSQWRKRLDFGTGTFGDMGCHIFDPVFKALALTAPISLRSEGPAPDQWNWATNAVIRYVFPGTKYTAGNTIPITWYDGDMRPPAEIRALIKPPAAGDVQHFATDGQVQKKKRAESDDQGSILIGTEGVLYIPHVATPKLFPVEKFKDYPMPQPEQGHHWTIFAEACVNGGPMPSASFDYSGPLTETVLLGSVAVRFPQATLQWNSEKLRFDNEKAANAFLRRSYRKEFQVAGL